MDKKTIVNNIYHASVISGFSIGYSMLSKKLFKIASPSVKKFELEDMAKLAAVIASSQMTMEYLMKEKIIPEELNI